MARGARSIDIAATAAILFLGHDDLLYTNRLRRGLDLRLLP